MRWLTAIPIYNEAKSVRDVLTQVREYAPEILVVDDGSTDGTAKLLDQEEGILRIAHPRNRGYGAALESAFDFARTHAYDVLVTMDCDGQHQPDRIPVLLEQVGGADIVSGSRYLRDFRTDTPAPSDRRYINATITRELNERYGLNITDAFCGFKAYRLNALRQFRVTETGWGMPLQVWVQAAKAGLKVTEIGVPRVYLDPSRAFGGVLNDPTERLAYYRTVIEAADQECEAQVGCCSELA
ncbi:glycosyltransferase family 2 protein [Limnoglobus roseus]|uniref:GT2 family glycosyltransferase n=1 Tax=Limnoglobus roseus TaxID=2598579 RepID=A0A5C1AK35_9BACT|nr:glycosyltransferase family 2 protein [Limnoglobus roseus]QEL19035.1 GT2 family glycosyltransferase [Limnoglobus roseus]